jgi:hypothetical protein
MCFKTKRSGKLCTPKKHDVSEQFRIPSNKELSYVCKSRGIVSIVKCRMLKWSEPVARMGEENIGGETYWKTAS